MSVIIRRQLKSLREEKEKANYQNKSIQVIELESSSIIITAK
jgi:hypothetical protein